MTHVKIAVVFSLAGFLCLLSASTTIAQTKWINPDNLQIAQYERITQSVEDGELVTMRRSVEYRLRHGHRVEIQLLSRTVLYVRTGAGASTCSSSWRKYVIRNRSLDGEPGVCVTELKKEPVLENIRHMFQDDFSKLIQIHAAIPHPSIDVISFEAWLHPQHWGDRALHESIIAKARAKAA